MIGKHIVGKKHGRDPDLQVLSMFLAFLISKTA